jgi:NADH:ubiquinone reductase (H+-translocating)
MIPNQALPHIVIVGAGFGGLRAARTFDGAPVRVTLVDRNNYHLFQPLLYQVATSALSPDGIAYPVRSIFRRQKNLSFHMGAVTAIDLETRTVVNETGTLAYDSLILALGGETHYFGLDSVAEHGFGLKSLEDATTIRNHLLAQFELAAKEPDPQRRKALLTFVIAGGGPTGVECAGAISELIRMVLKKDYPAMDFSDVRVVLLEAMDRLLSGMPEDLGKFTVEVLVRKNVEVCLNTAVARYDGQQVVLKDGSLLPAHTLVWAAGVRASRLIDSLGLPQDRMGRVKVEPTLQVPGHPEVYVIGDSAFLQDAKGAPLPMVAPVAMQQGEGAARNILRLMKGETPKSFTFKDPGVLATIGRNQAVARLGNWKFRGFHGLGGLGSGAYSAADWLPQPDGRFARLGLELPVL